MVSLLQDFVLDFVPGTANVVVGGGGSGHAFKLGPVIGRSAGPRRSSVRLDQLRQRVVRIVYVNVLYRILGELALVGRASTDVSVFSATRPGLLKRPFTAVVLETSPSARL